MKAEARIFPVIIFIIVFSSFYYQVTSYSRNRAYQYEGIILSELGKFNKSNKPTVLYVYSTWCSSCSINYDVLESKSIKDAYNVVGIPIKDSEDRIMHHSKMHPQLFDDLVLNTSDSASIQKKLGLNSMPNTFVIDTAGAIIYSRKGKIFKDEILNAIRQ